MAITFTGAATTATRANDTTPGGTITVATPSGVAVGEHVLFVAGIRRSSSAPTNWTAPAALASTGLHNDAQSSGPHHHAWYLYVEDQATLDGLPADWTFETPSVTGDMAAIAVRVAGANPLGFLDALGSAAAMSAGSTSVAIPAVTTTTSGTRVVAVVAKSHGENNLTWTAPLTAVASAFSTNATVQNRIGLLLGSYEEADPGDTGALAATTGSSRAWASHSAALAPTVLTADAGPDQTVTAGQLVELDGTDTVGATTWAWTQDPGDDADVIFDATDEATARFTAPAPTDGPMALHFTLDITGATPPGTASDDVTVTVNPAAGTGIPFFVLHDGEWAPIGTT